MLFIGCSRRRRRDFIEVILLIMISLTLVFSNTTPANVNGTSYNNSTTSGAVQVWKTRVVVSLTSIPRRLRHLHSTLRTILDKQHHRVDLVQINLPRVFLRTGSTYDDIDRHSFLQNDRIRIVRCEDYGPATKLLPTLETETDPTTLIVLVDDDTAYPGNFISAMLSLHKQGPQFPIVGHPGDILLTNNLSSEFPLPSSSLLDPLLQQQGGGSCCVHMFEAYGGVGYPRGLFDDPRLNFSQYMNITLANPYCRRSDDVVLSNYFALLNISGISMAQHMTKLWQLSHGFEDGPDGALHKLGTGHPYNNCSQYLHKNGIGKLRFRGGPTRD